METSFKTRLFDYLTSHNDGSEEANWIIREMKFEMCYADCNTHSISTDDLDNYYDQKTLREKLGKKEGEPYTIDDCEKVCDAVADYICEDFSEDLANAINYEL